MKHKKYKRGYFIPTDSDKSYLEWSRKEYIQSAPLWCSVDLRDGNQALITPMNLEEKITFFKLLLQIGFKDIEVGFPAASETEYRFLRTLIEQNLIPRDVRLQVLTQAREHIIKRTFEALQGCPNAIVHFYNSTSYAQRQQVFKKSKEDIKKIAIDGALCVKQIAQETKGNFSFEYSPESFSGTEMEYALEVSNAVIDIFKPTKEQKFILNLPATVEMSLPHIYAQQVEFINKNLLLRDNVLISLHPHNDRGCAVASAELGILAGADRIEGTLFGNGERTGNVDIITLALNLTTHGIDSKLDFSNLPHICDVYESVTKMQVYERQPYAGKLVFAAFSGSHQDAIAKGMTYHKEKNLNIWSVPYLPIDPQDVGRVYESDVIRINSQSGKGGIAYILHEHYGANLPPLFREEFSYYIKDISDKTHKELSPHEICVIFEKDFVNYVEHLELGEFSFETKGDECEAHIELLKPKKVTINSKGNGRLDSIANALRQHLHLNFDILDYSEHALKNGSNAKAIAYVHIESQGNHKNGKTKKYFGAGIDNDIIKASVYALVSALNRIYV